MINITELINRKYGNEEKGELKELIKVIIILSEKAYHQGLLSLDEVYSDLNPFLLRKGTEIISEGCSTSEITYFLDKYIETIECSEVEMVENLIIREGLLLIKNDYIGKMFFEKLISMLGEDFFGDFHYSSIEKGVNL